MRRRVLPGLTLSLGITLFYVGLIVVLPLGALVFKAASLGPEDYWRIVSSPRAVASYRVTVLSALAATAFNLVFGMALAWVLVRYRFPGRRLIDAIVDLPFALPTAVAGIALTTLFAQNARFGSVLPRPASRSPHAARHHGGDVSPALRSSCAPCSRCWRTRPGA